MWGRMYARSVTNALLAVPNLTTGGPSPALDRFAERVGSTGITLLDRSVDLDHGRSVHTVAGQQGALASGLAEALIEFTRAGDLRGLDGVHPHVGLVDVAPIVYLSERDRGAACAEALVLAARLGEGGVPVILYGELAGGLTRAEIRKGGLEELRERVDSGEMKTDFGPHDLGPRIGATMVGARQPLVAFNLILGQDVGLDDARVLAAEIREGGSIGLPGVRALGLELKSKGRVQLSMNLERPGECGIQEVCEACSDRIDIEHGELIGLAPRAVIDRIPSNLPMPGLDPDVQSIEGSLRLSGIRH